MNKEDLEFSLNKIIAFVRDMTPEAFEDFKQRKILRTAYLPTRWTIDGNLEQDLEIFRVEVRIS
jgi:hypothetical protein